MVFPFLLTNAFTGVQFVVGIFKAVTGNTDVPSFYWPEVVKIRKRKMCYLKIPVSGMLLVLEALNCVNYRNKGKRGTVSYQVPL